MTEDMLEDLPVTKRINVMVGITRSKVIFRVSTPTLEDNSWLLPMLVFLGWGSTLTKL